MEELITSCSSFSLATVLLYNVDFMQLSLGTCSFHWTQYTIGESRALVSFSEATKMREMHYVANIKILLYYTYHYKFYLLSHNKPLKIFHFLLIYSRQTAYILLYNTY